MVSPEFPWTISTIRNFGTPITKASIRARLGEATRSKLGAGLSPDGFPRRDEGEILVKYDAQDSGWQLSVSDNGSGPKEAAGEPAYIGLGTSIVEALAHQLKATVEKSSGPEGTWVTITAAEHP
jgi:signal transduction histidine kinase